MNLNNAIYRKVIILGAGPAGISAAIQLKRLGIDFILINDCSEVGGLLKNANLIENFPSHPKGIKAKKLIESFENHLKHLKIEVTPSQITLVDFKNDKFYLESNSGDDISSFASDYLILATGTKPLVDKNVIMSNDARSHINYEIKDILDIKNKKIVIVGAGDAAFDYALNLSKKNEIIILNRSEKIKSLPILVERAKKNKRIDYLENTFIDKIDYSDNTFFLSVRSDSIDSIICDYLIYAIGREPNYPKFGLHLEKSSSELINSEKLLYIGDLVNGIARQSSIAIGDGIRAAMKINSKV